MYDGKFWRLDDDDRESALADWTDDVRLEQIVCPRYPGHRRAGRRLTPLTVELPVTLGDFVWTWGGECLIQASVLAAFRGRGISGFEVRRAAARFPRDHSQPAPELWELVITGWGGVAPPESGIRLDESKSCNACGHLSYTAFTDASHLIDPRAWDGSDCFIVWPLPRYHFVTDRVRDLICSEEFTGVSLLDANELKWPAGVIPALSPGRLSYWFSEEAARRIGGPLGIA